MGAGDLAACYRAYEVVFQVRPPPSAEPSVAQVTALRHLKDEDRLPYVDFAL